MNGITESQTRPRTVGTIKKSGSNVKRDNTAVGKYQLSKITFILASVKAPKGFLTDFL